MFLFKCRDSSGVTDVRVIVRSVKDSYLVGTGESAGYIFHLEFG